MDKLKETFGIREKFSLENARHLCDEVEKAEELALGDDGAPQRAKAVEAAQQSIRALTEVLVWMDRNNEEWFERVMERDVMNMVERLVTNGFMPSAIKLQGLQCVTVLLQNLSRTSSIYYVCSNNHINRMVAVEFDMHDDEFVSLYVSFLKSLALRCTPDTVQFFFDLQDGAFPLWDRAVRLLASRDAMVRTAAKQIIVTIAQLKDRAVAAFVLRSIADVFLSVMRCVDGLLTKLAAEIPTHSTLFSHVASLKKSQGGGEVAGRGSPCATASQSPSPSRPQPQPSPPVNPRAIVVALEDMEDELLYLNDLCYAAGPEVGRHAQAAVEQVFLARFERVIEQEVRAAAPPTSPQGETQAPANDVAAAPAGDVPACVALGFLHYWLLCGPAPPLSSLLVGFLLRPMTATSANMTAAPTTVASLVLQSTRVDLHEATAAILLRSLAAFPAGPPPQLRFPASLAQFYFAHTPYQQTGEVLVGGPSSTLPPPKDAFVQKAWVGGSAALKCSPSPTHPRHFDHGSHPGSPGEGATAQNSLAPLIPHLFAALYTQLRFIQVSRLRCFACTLAVLTRLLGQNPPLAQPHSPAQAWETAYLEVMKLVQRVLLDGVKQCASRIQQAVRAQRAADGEVPLARIAVEELDEGSPDGEAPLPLRDPYAAMFLKLRIAAMWLDAEGADRQALLAPAYTKKDHLHLFFPAFPILKEDTKDLLLNAWPPLIALHRRRHRHTSYTQEAVLHAYYGVQVTLAQTLPLSARSPVNSQECEINLYVAFLLAKHAFEGWAVDTAVGSLNVLSCTLRRLWPQYVPSRYFTIAATTAAVSARCELASEWHVNAATPGFAPLGTPLCLVVPSALTGEGGRELLLLDVQDDCPGPVRARELSTGEFKRRVLLSLDLSFVSVAVHSKYSFRVVVSYQLLGHAMQLHLVFCDSLAAKAVVTDIEKAANDCRARGASFCFGIMNYRSALLDS